MKEVVKKELTVTVHNPSCATLVASYSSVSEDFFILIAWFSSLGKKIPSNSS